MKPEVKNCAIYTRKSTDEGLDQDFNSLDAQRESCAAYIISQKAEGWKEVRTQYDDGGYSGGNLDRPGLQKLLNDIKDGKVQTVVVYKIDRLTRSLMDFAKLVEVFDEHNVTFVSVTQSFNTTTSMGRLTLNVLLSFAQFEREVTGERIRDKIAASKKKGMWMGGFPPVGYQRADKKIVPHPEELQIVRYIFDEYHKRGSVKNLYKTLQQKNYKTPVRVSSKGRKYGNCTYSRGHLYRILSNPIYIGKIKHKNEIYDGLHDGIISEEVFEQVQQKLKYQGQEFKNKTIASGSLLKGKLYDCDGVIYSPTYTNKKGVRYSYYISQNLVQYRDHPKGIMARIPAHEIEKTITFATENWLKSVINLQSIFPDTSENHLQWIAKNFRICDRLIGAILRKSTVQIESLTIEIDAEKLSEEITSQSEMPIKGPVNPVIKFETPFKTHRAKNGAIIINSAERRSKDPFDIPNDQLKRIVKGIIWRDEHFTGSTIKDIAQKSNHGENYINRCIQESFHFLSQ